MTKTTTNVTASYGRRRRTVLGLGVGATALLLGFASVAYACTLLIGTFTVCNPPNSGWDADDCAQRVGVSLQTGVVEFDDGGSNISVVGSDFSAITPTAGTKYSITFAVAGPSCHQFNVSGGVTSLLGVDGTGKPNTVDGPDFNVGNGGTPHGTVTTPAVGPGLYSVCAQDEPQRVDGNAINGQVGLL